MRRERARTQKNAHYSRRVLQPLRTTSSQATKKSEAGEKSFRFGATLTAVASMPANINCSHASVVEMTYSTIIELQKLSNEPNAGLIHSVGSEWSCSCSSPASLL